MENNRLFPRHMINEQSALRVELWPAMANANRYKPSSKDIIDISNGGLSFKSPLTDDIILPGTSIDKIEILSPAGCLLKTTGEVKHISYHQADANGPSGYAPISIPGHSYRIGLEFGAELTDHEYKPKSNPSKQRENISNPFDILDSFKRIIKNMVPVSVENMEYPTQPVAFGYFTQITSTDRFYTITFEPAKQYLHGQLFEDFDRVQVMYQLNADGYKFASVIISRTQNKLVLKFPRSISFLWQRSSLRYAPPPDDILKLKVIHPLLKGKPLERRLIDLTPNGISMVTEYPQDLFIKNMFIPQIVLTIPRKRRIIASAQVKYISLAIDAQMSNYFKCGLSFVNISAEDTDFLVSYLLHQCYPHLKDAQGERMGIIWHLFSEAGFIYDEKKKFLAPLATEVNDTLKKLLEPDTKFYKKVILKEGGKCYGTVSGIRAYEHTWIIQHLAALKHPQRLVSKDVVLAIADFCAKHPNVGYQKIFWRPNNPWPDKIFGKYARRVSDKTDLSHLVCYDYLIKTPLIDDPEINPPAGVVIDLLTKDERPLIESYFVARKEFVTLQADSLLRDEMDLPQIREMYSRKGLRR